MNKKVANPDPPKSRPKLPVPPSPAKQKEVSNKWCTMNKKRKCDICGEILKKERDFIKQSGLSYYLYCPNKCEDKATFTEGGKRSCVKERQPLKPKGPPPSPDIKKVPIEVYQAYGLLQISPENRDEQWEEDRQIWLELVEKLITDD